MKKHGVVLFMLAVSLLTGCDQVDNWVEQKGLEKAGIEDSEEYKQAQEYQSKNEYAFNEEGLVVTDFSEDAVQAMASISGIHITAAENSNLDVKYYYDAGKTQEITDIGSVGFNKNDVIYVQAAPKSDENKLYEFSEIVVYDIGDNNEKNNAVNDIWDSAASLIRIPEDYNGTELAIEPIGHYLLCKASFEAYCSDGQNDTPVDCNWTVDGSPYNSGTKELDPTQHHDISVTFDDDNYYYVSSDESCGFSDARDASGKSVRFQNISLTDKESRFVIKLHKLLKCDISNSEGDCITDVTVNGVSVNEKNKLNLPKLKVGDKITLEMKDGFSAKCIQIENKESESLENGKRISFVLPDTSENIQIITACEYQEPKIDNATITAVRKDTGETLKNGDLLPGDTTIKVTITPDEGYKIQGDNWTRFSWSIRSNTYTNEMKMSEYKTNKDNNFKIVVKSK